MQVTLSLTHSRGRRAAARALWRAEKQALLFFHNASRLVFMELGSGCDHAPMTFNPVPDTSRPIRAAGGFSSADLPAVRRALFADALSAARQEHDPVERWEAFVQAAWDEVGLAFGLLKREPWPEQLELPDLVDRPSTPLCSCPPASCSLAVTWLSVSKSSNAVDPDRSGGRLRTALVAPGCGPDLRDATRGSDPPTATGAGPSPSLGTGTGGSSSGGRRSGRLDRAR